MKKILILGFLLNAFCALAQKENSIINDSTPPTADDSVSVKTAPEKDVEPLVIVEENAAFPGGIEIMHQFVRENTRYPELEQKAQIEGTVHISFVVEKDGSITHIQLQRAVPGGPGLTKEAIRIISIMPKWIPAKNNGQVVRQQYYLPVKFRLKQEEVKVLPGK